MSDAQFYKRLEQEKRANQNKSQPVNEHSIMTMKIVGTNERDIIEEADEADSFQDCVDKIVKDAEK